MKKCKVCKAQFEPFNSTQTVCGPACALELAKIKRKKHEAAELKKVRSQLRQLSQKDLPKSRRAAQAAFNAYIRERDKDLPCISCQRHHEGQYHAGHYLSRGAHPELAFEESNCHKQCAPCNNHLSGNIARYRINLIEKIGQKKVDWLEGPHDSVKYTAEELRAIEKLYKQKRKELQNG